MGKKSWETEREELQLRHDGGITETEESKAILRNRIAYLDYKIALETDN